MSPERSRSAAVCRAAVPDFQFSVAFPFRFSLD